MTMIYSLMDRNLIFAQDATYSHQSNNQKKVYKYQKWETYGYLDYVTYADYLNALKAKGEIDEDTRSKAVAFGRTKDQDSELVSEYVKEFTAYYKAKGYTVRRYDAIMMGKKKYANGGQQQLFAYRDIPLATRLGKYFSGLIDIDSIHDAAGIGVERFKVTPLPLVEQDVERQRGLARAAHACHHVELAARNVHAQVLEVVLFGIDDLYGVFGL